MSENKKRIITFLMVITLVIGGTFTPPYQPSTKAASFSDVKAGYYAEKEIQSLVEKGIISGFEDGSFKPEQTVSRGEFAIMIARALQLPSAASSFKDVSRTTKVYEGISKAFKAGIVSGYSDGTFRPGEPIKRSDIAIMIDKALQYKGDFPNTIEIYFDDVDMIGKSALVPIKRLVNYKILKPTYHYKIEPNNPSTRAFTAITIYNLLYVIETKKNAVKTDPDLTLAELRKVYGEHKIAYRSWGNSKIYLSDFVESYYNYDKKYYATFNEYIDMQKESFRRQYNVDFPYGELIHYNGKAYVNSTLYKGDELEQFMDSLFLPRNPDGEDEFSLDVHLNSTNAAIYLKDNVIVKVTKNAPYYDGNVIMLEVESLLNDKVKMKVEGKQLTLTTDTSVTFTADSSKALVNGSLVELGNKVAMKDGKFMIPIRESAKLLNLYTRTFTGLDVNKENDITRIEVSNFPLEEDYRRN